MKTYWVTLNVFIKTMMYVLWSVIQPRRLQELKQKWAQALIKDFGYRIESRGVPPLNDNQPLILVGNHISFLDILVLMAEVKEIVFIAKKEVRSWPVIGLGAHRAKTIFVDRENKNNRSATRAEIAKQLWQNRAKVVVFPSGTTTLKEELVWKKGMFEVAAEAGLPVKVFVVSYSPLRDSAYIDDDTLIGQMNKVLRIQNKIAYVTWLDEHNVVDPAASAEMIRQKVAQTLSTFQ